MNKIILTSVRNLMTDDNIKSGRDYKITLTAERISEEKIDNEEDYFKYRLKVSEIREIEDVKESKKIEIKDGRTKSQQIRFRAEQELGDYDSFAQWILNNMDRLCDEFRDNN